MTNPLKSFMQTEAYKNDLKTAKLFLDYKRSMFKTGRYTEPYIKNITLETIKVWKKYKLPLRDRIVNIYTPMVRALNSNIRDEFETFGLFNKDAIGRFYGADEPRIYNHSKAVKVLKGELSPNATLPKLLSQIKEILNNCESNHIAVRHLGNLHNSSLRNLFDRAEAEISIVEAIDIPELTTSVKKWRQELHELKQFELTKREEKAIAIYAKFEHPTDRWKNDITGNILRNKISSLYNSKKGIQPIKVLIGEQNLRENITYVSESLVGIVLSATHFYALIKDDENEIIYDYGWYQINQETKKEDIFIHQSFTILKKTEIKEKLVDNGPTQEDIETQVADEVAKAQQEGMAEVERIKKEAEEMARKAIEDAQKMMEEMMKKNQ